MLKLYCHKISDILSKLSIKCVEVCSLSIYQSLARPTGDDGRQKQKSADKAALGKINIDKRSACEGGVQRFDPLQHGELHGNAVVKMTHDLAAHCSERHLRSKRRLDVTLNRSA